jgi:signal transduction histidine kinase
VNLTRLWRPSLVRRLVLLAAIWSLAVLAVTGVALTALFQRETIDHFDEGLLDTVNGLYAGSSVNEDGTVDAPPLTDSRATRAYSGKYWEIAESAGGRLHALARSRSLWDSALEAPPKGAGELTASPGKPIYYNAVGPVREPLRVAALLTQLPGRAAPVIFMAAEDRTPVDAASRGFAAVVAGALVVLGLGQVLAMLIQVRVGLAPLFALRREVAAVRTGHAERVVGEYPSELKPLSEELNALVAHDQEVMERQRTHVGNLAHALKTPLSVVLAEAERNPGPLADVVMRQADAMRNQVDHHLRRARAAARSQGLRERTPVAPVLEEIAHALERIFRERGMQIDWRADEDLVFQGERQDLMEIVGNVLENACKYGDDRVRATARPSGASQLLLVVEDNGAGLPASRRQEVLRRGARLDESAPGSGLGLAIVEDLARAYGGSVSLDDSALGGLKVSVALPRAVG